MKPLDIDDAFEEFMRKCYPEVPETANQYRECRRVFYSGVLTCLDQMKSLANFPDDVGVAEIESLTKQCDEFFIDRLFHDKD